MSIFNDDRRFSSDEATYNEWLSEAKFDTRFDNEPLCEDDDEADSEYPCFDGDEFNCEMCCGSYATCPRYHKEETK